MKHKSKIKQVLFFALIVATVLFIWSRSFSFADDSTAQSNWAKQLLIDFFEIFNFDIQKTFFFRHIRKFAHFAEFFVLGSELMIYRYIYMKKSKQTLFATFGLGALVAVLDETIQLIPALGRDGKITDVLIDFSGVLFAGLTVFVTSLIISKFRAKSTLHNN